MTQNTMPKLTILLAVAVCTLFIADRFVPHVEADDAVKADPLGPAPSLTLENDDAEAVTVKVDQKRLAWGEGPQKRVYSSAYVHIGKPLSLLLQGDSFIEENQDLSEELQAAEQSLRDAAQSIQDRMQGLTPEDDGFESVNQEAQALMQQRNNFIQNANAAKASLGAQQVERAYKALIDAVNVVADRMDIDIVHRFIPTDDPFEVAPGPQAFQNAMLQIRLRSLLRYPDGIDITSDVMEELGVE